MGQYELTACYYDSGDRRLAASGLTLRRRLERGVNTWQLTAPDDGDGLELEGTAGPAAPPDSFAPLLRAQLGDRRLQKLATLRTARSVRPAVSRPSRKAPALTHVQARSAELQRAVLRADAGLRLRDDP